MKAIPLVLFFTLLYILVLLPRMWASLEIHVRSCPCQASFPSFWPLSLLHSQYLTTSNTECFLAQGQGPERLVSGSDDFTLFLWSPAEDKKPLTRMTGHQALINQVLFSPDSRIVASASFDKSIKLWDGRTGK